MSDYGRRMISAGLSLLFSLSAVIPVFSAGENGVDYLKRMTGFKEIENPEQVRRKISEIDTEIENSNAKKREERSIFREIYVSCDGNDNNSGSKDEPFLTIEKAKEYAVSISDQMNGDIIINVSGGTYFLDKPLEFLTEDSGKNGHNIIFRGEKDNMPVISGGVKVEGVRQSEKYPLLYEAYVPGFSIDGIRELYVDGEKKHVAQSENWIFASGNYKAPGSQYSTDGFYVSKNDLKFMDDISDVDFGFSYAWIEGFVLAERMFDDPQNSDRMIVQFKNPLWETLGAKNVIYPSYDKAFVVRNHMSLLDSPNEFYYDRKTSMLYYMPSDGETVESEFIVPKLDFAMFFVGNDTDDKVKNITFENFKIAHFTGVYTYNSISIPMQAIAETVKANETSYDGDMGTIHLDKAENINFFDNYFFGMRQIGIRFYNDCSDCNVTGNAFSDIGSSAVAVGNIINYSLIRSDRIETEKPVIEQNPKTSFCLNMKYPAISTSYYEYGNMDGLHVGGTTACNITSIPDVNDYDKYKNNTKTWHSNPEDIGNKKSWVEYDMFRPYSYDQITLCFRNEEVKAEEKSNYEILMSNDKHFSEGNYVVAATQEAAAEEVQSYKIDNKDKYRYVMIRTKDNTPLALTFAYIFTPDLPNGTREAMCDGIIVSDNVITRVCDQRVASTALFGYAGNNIHFVHNDISKVPYSAVSFGWGWAYNWHCGKGNTIGYNNIHDVMQTMSDGGAVYTLSYNQDMIIHNNYLTATNAGVSIYPDQGSSGLWIIDNVCDGVKEVRTDNSTNRGSQLAFGNNRYNISSAYPDANVVKQDASVLTVKDLDDVKIYLAGDYNASAEMIKDNAGVRNGRCPAGKYADLEIEPPYSVWSAASNFDARSVQYKEAMEKILGRVLAEGKFGFDYGEYDYKMKSKLEKIADMDDASNNTKTQTYTALFKEITDSFKRVSFDEMLATCEEKLNSVIKANKSEMRAVSADVQAAYADDYDKFKKAVTEAELIKETGTYEEKYNMRNRLEDAYNEFEKKLSVPGINYIDIDGLVSCTVDAENKRISLQVDTICDGKKGLNVILASNTMLASDFDEVKLNGSLTLPIYSKGAKKYAFWTVETTVVSAGADEAIIPQHIKTDSPALDAITSGKDGSAFFAPMKGQHIYYYDTIKDAKNRVLFKYSVENAVEKNKYALILGAEKLDDFKFSSKESWHDRIEIEFMNNIMTVYTVKSGNKKAVYTETSRADYGKINEISYTLNAVGQNTEIEFSINGFERKILAPDIACGGMFGFYSVSNGITVYE